MDHIDAARRLERSAAALHAFLKDIPAEQLRWRPQEEAWSMLEVLGHLADEERRDFFPRMVSTLEDPTVPWETMDPEAEVRRQRHQEQPPHRLLGEFRRRRTRNLRQLRRLRTPDFERTYEHPALGALRAGDLLLAWVDHDLLHFRQLLALSHQQMLEENPGFNADYAGGKW